MIPWLRPELHRKLERRRKLLVGFNGFSARKRTSQATRKEEEEACSRLSSSRRRIGGQKSPGTQAAADAHRQGGTAAGSRDARKRQVTGEEEGRSELKVVLTGEGGSGPMRKRTRRDRDNHA